MNLGSINVRIGVDSSGLTQGLNQARSQVQGFAATTGSLTQGMNALGGSSVRTGYAIRSGVGAALSGLGVQSGGAARGLGMAAQGLATLGTAGTAAATSLGAGLVAAIIAVGVESVKASTQLNAMMADVATLIPDQIERVKELKGAVQDLAVSTGKGTDDISRGLYQVISAYGDTADTAKSLQLVTEAGIAGLSTTEEALKLISTQTKAYGDNSLAAQKHVADLDFLTVRLGQTTFPQLAAAMPKVEEVAHTLGIAQEEVNAAFATTSGVMGGANRASTQLASVMVALLKPTDSMKALFKAVGVEGGPELIAKLGGLQETLAFIVATAKASHQPLGDFIGRAEGMKTALFLAGEGAKDYQTKLDAMMGATGAMQAAFAEQENGINQVGKDWEKLKQAITVASQNIGDALVEAFGGHRTLSALTSFTGWLTRSAKAVNEWRNPAKGFQIGYDWETRRQELAEAGGREMGDAGLRSFMMTDLAPAPAREAPGGGIKGAVLPDKKALAALASEQSRYTQELAGAHERLDTLLAGEGNIAGQVAARYHLLTAAQRDNLTAVLKAIEHQTQLNAVSAHMESNSRVRALLSKGESVEVAKLGGQYKDLSTAELRTAFASEKATEAALRAAESRKAYTKDLGTLNAEIRRLKQGHDAEASGVDALKEKYPGLSNAMLAAMNNAIQWRKHLQGVREEAHRVAEALRGVQTNILKAGTDNQVYELAAERYAPKELAKGFRPPSAQSIFEGLDPATRRGLIRETATNQFSNTDNLIKAQRRQFESMVGESGELRSPVARRTQEMFGADWQKFLSGGQVQSLSNKVSELLQYEKANRTAAAAVDFLTQEEARREQITGTATLSLEKLQEEFGILTGKSSMARTVLAQFGVNLATLPKATQATVRGIVELQRKMDFFKEFAQGTQQVFENMFQGLYEHGFKGFFRNVVQGFEQMLQQMAARYLASRLTDLVTGLIGGFFGAGAAAAGGGGGGRGGLGSQIRASFGNLSLSGKAAGGTVQAMTPYPVGEHGPELFVPSSSGTILPNSQLAVAGGGNVHITLNVSTPDVAGFRRNSKALTQDAYRHAQMIQRRNG